MSSRTSRSNSNSDDGDRVSALPVAPANNNSRRASINAAIPPPEFAAAFAERRRASVSTPFAGGPPPMTRRLSVSNTGTPIFIDVNSNNNNQNSNEIASGEPVLAPVERLEFLQRRMTQKVISSAPTNDIGNGDTSSSSPIAVERRPTFGGKGELGRRATQATISHRKSMAVDRDDYFFQQQEEVEEEEQVQVRSLFKRLFIETADEALAYELDENAIYPFLKDIETEDFVLCDRHRMLYVFIGSLIVSAIVLVALSVAWNASVTNQSYLPFPIAGILISLSGIYNYKDTWSYRINLEQKEYTFWVGSSVKVKGPIYNVYIRLIRNPRGGYHKKLYYLVFRGFGIKEYRLTGLTHKVSELRKLGQQLAASLGINYFDEANTSEHHKVRHVKNDLKNAINKLSTSQLNSGMGSSYSINGTTR